MTLTPHLDRLTFSPLAILIGSPIDGSLTADERRGLTERQSFALPESLDGYFADRGEYEAPEGWLDPAVSKAWDRLIDWASKFADDEEDERTMTATRYGEQEILVEDGRYLLGYPGVDACSELDFASVDAMTEGFRSETYQTLVRDDEDDFVDKTRFSLVVTNATVVIDAEPGRVKLIRLFRTHPSRERDELVRTLRHDVATMLESLGGRYAVYEPVDEPHDGPPASFDAIATLWIAVLIAAWPAILAPAGELLDLGWHWSLPNGSRSVPVAYGTDPLGVFALLVMPLVWTAGNLWRWRRREG